MEQQYSLSRRTFLAGSAVAAATAGLALSGCGSSSSSEGGKPSGSAANTGGVITAACSYKNANYNPIGASSALMLPAIQHCLEGLYELDYFTGESNAALAAGEPVKVSETEYEVALREGATFSNGEAVTAADVVAVIEANKANATYKDMLSFIDTVAAKDDATVSFTLAYPFVDSDKQLKERLSLCRVFPAAEITKETMTTPPTGSGAWAFGECNGEDGGELFRVIPLVQLGTAHQDHPAADEVPVERAIGKGRTVGGDEQVRSVKVGGPDGHQLELHRELPQL